MESRIWFQQPDCHIGMIDTLQEGIDMIMETLNNIGWSIVFSLVGGLIGMVLVLLFSLITPRVIDRLTPHIDEQKEIARGNTAVAEYFGRIVSATILGLSIVAAAAVLGGIIAALH
jgi:uncharacterized membrane protein YjfL (UPF0719 family)